MKRRKNAKRYTTKKTRRGSWKRLYDRRSIRTIRIGKRGRLLRIGCPKGFWRPRLKHRGKRGRCDKGMRGFEILTPRGAWRRILPVKWRRSSRRIAANPQPLFPERHGKRTVYYTRGGKYAGEISEEGKKSFRVATVHGFQGWAGSKWKALGIIEKAL